MKKKYAMIPINYKHEDDGIHVRRVLIRYHFKTKFRNIITYHGTKFVIADFYFSNAKASHKYEFKDKYYQLIKTTNSMTEFEYTFKPQLYSKRKYHSITLPTHKNVGAIEFKAKNLKEAIEKFRLRKELK